MWGKENNQGNLIAKQSTPPEGVGVWISNAERDARFPDWKQINDDAEVVIIKSKDEQIAELDTEYDPKFDALTLAWAIANMDGDMAIAAARLEDKTALKAEYEWKRQAILNG